MSKRRARGAAIVLSLALLGLLGGVVPASAGCEDGIAFCDPERTSGELAHVRQVAALLSLRGDNEGLSSTLYAALVPDGFELPSLLQVGVALREVSVPGGPAEGALAVRTEAVVALRVTADGKPGWYPLRVGTDAPDRLEWGRGVGWPTVAVHGSFEAAGSGWIAEARAGDESLLGLDWTPGNVPVNQPTIDWTLGNHPLFSLTPVFEGPGRHRVKVTPKPPAPVFDPVGGPPFQDLAIPGVTALAPVVRGLVAVRLAADLGAWDADTEAALPDLPFGEEQSLADLVLLEQSVNGLYWESDALLLTEAHDLEEEPGPPLPLPPAAGVVIAGPMNQGIPYFYTPIVVVTRGSSVTFANLDVPAGPNHDVISDDRDADHRPIFRSDLFAPGEYGPVNGVEDLPAGEYGFYCSIHPNMTGLLSVR